MSLDAFEATFVKDQQFVESSTRGSLWEEWTDHRDSFCAVANRVNRAWVSGSFVTARPDPRDIDVTYFIESSDYDALEDEDRGFLAQMLDQTWCRQTAWRIDAHLITVFSDLEYWQLEATDSLSREQREAFTNLGLYDEVWRRSKVASSGVSAQRGYVEVVW